MYSLANTESIYATTLHQVNSVMDFSSRVYRIVYSN